eukprot:gene26806-33445_t
MIPAVIGEVAKHLKHDTEPVLKRAVFQDMMQDDVMQFKDLVRSQLRFHLHTEHRLLLREYDYHPILLCGFRSENMMNQAFYEGMYEVLVDVMKRADTRINAEVVKIVKTVTLICPTPSISRFICSVLKYTCIKGLPSTAKKDHAGPDAIRALQCVALAALVQTVIKVFELAGDQVKVSNERTQTLTQLIAEDGNKDDEGAHRGSQRSWTKPSCR